MSTRQLCQNCLGSGQQMGGGMMKEPCTQCDDGFIYPAEKTCKSEVEIQKNTENTKITPKIDTKSKEYKHAVKELMKLGLSKEEAEKQFEDKK